MTAEGQWGRGTQKIVDWCKAAGQPEPEYEERSGGVVVRFFPSGYAAPLRVSHDLTDRRRRLLRLLSAGGEWTFPEIYQTLGNSPSERTVRFELRVLSDLELVGSRGRGRFTRW